MRSTMPDNTEVLAMLARIEGKLDRVLAELGHPPQMADADPGLPAPPGGWPNGITPPVFFANERWAVTGDGLEHLGEGAYRIEGERVADKRRGTDVFDWPLHVAEQEWTHLEAFLDAFAYALPRFCPKEFDTDRLARSVTEARRVKRLYQA
jgi:hypothetical protein